jgi:hypothetical protein
LWDVRPAQFAGIGAMAAKMTGESAFQRSANA